MFSATESKELRFHFLHKKDLAPIGYDKVRKDTGRHVDPDDVVRGFEIEKGKYVPIEDEDLDRLDIELTHSIDICDFVDLDEIDPIFYRKAYYLLPDDGAEKPYRLLVRALEETGKVGVAKVVIRNKQHLAALRPYDERAPVGDDVLRRRGSEARKRERQSQASEGRGRDGQVPRQEPERLLQAREVRRHVSQGAPRPDQGEGEGQGAAGAVRGARGRGRRPDGCPPRVGQGDEEQEQADQEAGPQGKLGPAWPSWPNTSASATRRRRRSPSAASKRGKQPIFVVQRHDARRLHYDFRLERNGALASWAVPKGVPLEPGQQHLAVHVEDHPLEYATFHGEIPKGEYGAGTVEIWDTGTYELVEDKPDGGLTVRLHGKRLEGTYALVPAHLSGDERNWLIVRKKDDSAPAARKTRRYQGMFATLVDAVPKGDDWLFEIKWDGYRIIATVSGGDPELRSRKDQDYTKRFENVSKELVKALKTPDCVVDGEVCALDEEGRPSFSAMQQGKSGTPIVYYLFDLLEVEGEPIVDLPIEERRKRLEKLLDKRNKTVRFSESFDDGEALLAAANEQGLEGIMAKRLGTRYFPGKRSRDWLKIKGHGRQEFVIAGYTRGKGRRERTLGSLVLGMYEGDELVYVGNVGTGFNDREIDRLLKKLKPLERKTPPFKDVPKMPRVRKGDVIWVAAEARRRGRVRRVDARRPAAGTRLQGPAGGQGRRRGAPRGA